MLASVLRSGEKLAAAHISLCGGIACSSPAPKDAGHVNRSVDSYQPHRHAPRLESAPRPPPRVAPVLHCAGALGRVKSPLASLAADAPLTRPARSQGSA